MDSDAVWLIGLAVPDAGDAMLSERIAFMRLSTRALDGTGGRPLDAERAALSSFSKLAGLDVAGETENRLALSTAGRGRPNSKGDEGRVLKEGTCAASEGDV